MGLRKKKKKTSEERRANAERWARRLDPARANGQVSVFDTFGGRTRRVRQAQRELDLIAEQKETNRLLKKQAERPD